MPQRISLGRTPFPKAYWAPLAGSDGGVDAAADGRLALPDHRGPPGLPAAPCEEHVSQHSSLAQRAAHLGGATGAEVAIPVALVEHLLERVLLWLVRREQRDLASRATELCHEKRSASILTSDVRANFGPSRQR